MSSLERIPRQEAGSELSANRYDRLEAGDILLFSGMLIELPEEDARFLINFRQKDVSYHKNIAYRPGRDKLTGVPAGPDHENTRRILRSFSRQAAELVGRMLARYAAGWKIGYTSFRPFEEEGRALPLHARNDLLHFDSFPTRPTGGDRILRCFVNLNPERPRVWITGESFDKLVQNTAFKHRLVQRARRAGSPWARRMAKIGSAVHLPQLGRPPYDAVMHSFHNLLKENLEFQQTCARDRWEFPPRSTWLVFTDMVSHAVLSGQMALEQTFLVPSRRLLYPERAPVAILERLAGLALL